MKLFRSAVQPKIEESGGKQLQENVGNKPFEAIVVESNHSRDMLRACSVYTWELKQRIMSRTGHLSNLAVADYIETSGNAALYANPVTDDVAVVDQSQDLTVSDASADSAQGQIRAGHLVGNAPTR